MWQLAHAGNELVVERGVAIVAVVASTRQIERRANETSRTVPVIDLREAVRGPKQQPGTRQQDQRDSELPDEQDRAHTRLPAAPTAITGRTQGKVKRLAIVAEFEATETSLLEDEVRNGAK